MERQRFDDSWKGAFEDAEMSPSDNLWTNIELDLEKAEGKKMKKRILYFKLMAAASVAFAMTFAAAGFFYMNNKQNDLTANNSTTIKSSSKTNTEITEANDVKVADDKATDNSGQNSNAVEEKSVRESTTDNANAAEPASGTPSNEMLAKNTEEDQPTQGDETGKTRNRSLEISKTQVAENSNDVTKSKSSTNSKSVRNTASVTSANKRASDNQREQSTTSDRMFDSANDVGVSTIKERKTQASDEVALAQPAHGEDGRMIATAKLPEIVHVRKPAYQPEPTSVDPVKEMLERLAAEEKKYASNKQTQKEDKRSKKGKEQVWTSVGFAAGSFNTVVSNTGTAMNSNFIQPQTTTTMDATYSMSDNIVREQSKASGISYAVGLALGGKLSERWVLQGGVNYMTQTSAYTANAVVGSLPDRTNQHFNSPINYTDFKLGSIEGLSNAGKNASLVSTASYDVNSNLQYLSVPLQAGYLIVNRDFGLQLNAGVSTDLFLQNTLTPEGGSLEQTKQAAGDESPYRTVNFSGLVGTELSYRFGQHYRVALNPGIRYPFSSIYKSEIAVDAMPLTFDVGLRFRYIFN